MAIAQTIADVSNLLTTVQDTINGKYGEFMKKIQEYQEELSGAPEKYAGKSEKFIERKQKIAQEKIKQIQEQAEAWLNEQLKKAQDWITGKLQDLTKDQVKMAKTMIGG